MDKKKKNIAQIKEKKLKGEKITMLTAYDCPFASLLDEAQIDIILVGDSAANVVLGYQNTIPVTMDEMILLTRSVSRGVKEAIVIGDMPFGSYNTSIEDAIKNANRFIKEGGADAVKVEGGKSVVQTVKALVSAGIPVMGHLGLTPQTSGMLGGYRVQAKTARSALELIEDALSLEKAGAFSIVVECIPDAVAKFLTIATQIPVIGIGAGPHCDGQVLVLHDMLGIKAGFTPKFVKSYANLNEIITEAVKSYKDEVERGKFPGPEHSFKMEKTEEEHLQIYMSKRSNNNSTFQ